jgi:hypothetical protein
VELLAVGQLVGVTPHDLHRPQRVAHGVAGVEPDLEAEPGELLRHLDDEEEILDPLQLALTIEQIEVDLAAVGGHDVWPRRNEEHAAVHTKVIRVEKLVELVERRGMAQRLAALP